MAIQLVSHHLLLPGPSTMCSITRTLAGTTLLRALQTALPDWHSSGLQDTAPFGCSSGMEGLSRRAPASKVYSAWISDKNILQSCLSCSCLWWQHSALFHHCTFLVGTSRLLPPGEQLSRHWTTRPCPAAGANTPLQITLLTSGDILWNIRALLHHMLLAWLQRRAPLPSFCTSTLKNGILSRTDCDSRIIRRMSCSQAISKEQSLGK